MNVSAVLYPAFPVLGEARSGLFLKDKSLSMTIKLHPGLASALRCQSAGMHEAARRRIA
jgi:hypothetical protein